MITKFLTAAAATAMVAAPVAASAAPATSLSVANTARASAPTTGANKAAGGAGNVAAIGLGVLLAGAFIYAIVDATDNNDSDSN